MYSLFCLPQILKTEKCFCWKMNNTLLCWLDHINISTKMLYQIDTKISTIPIRFIKHYLIISCNRGSIAVLKRYIRLPPKFLLLFLQNSFYWNVVVLYPASAFRNSVWWPSIQVRETFENFFEKQRWKVCNAISLKELSFQHTKGIISGLIIRNSMTKINKMMKVFKIHLG